MKLDLLHGFYTDAVYITFMLLNDFRLYTVYTTQYVLHMIITYDVLL